ncbi:MAG TPA: hypothetical protein VMV94_11950 [Phycisphaerae bacterium]|nr:hypothetical protein [Phycisphaerae bacterium]
MANASKKPVGTVVGIVLGVVLVGAIAATPFYLAKFESPDRAIVAAAGEDVETLRRVVLDLDQNLGALADMDAALAEGEKLTPEAAEQIRSAHEDIFGDELGRRLNETARLLKEYDKADEARKTMIPGAVPPPSSPLGAGEAVRQMRQKYLTVNDKLRTQATAAIDQLKRLSTGEATAGGVVAINRIEATYYYLAGRMLCNRADFEQEQAAAWRRAAVERLQLVASLQREVEALQAQEPTTAMENVRDLVKQVSRQIDVAKDQVAQLRPVVESLSAKVAELDGEAAEAHRQMAELTVGEGQLRRADQAARYMEWATKARQAEASAEALRNGTLVDAEVMPAEADDTHTFKYRGGRSQPGLRDLQFRLQQIEEDLATWQASRSALKKQEDSLKTQSKQVEQQQREAAASAGTYAAEVRDLLAKADEFAKAAGQARGKALESLKQAESFAQKAVADANKRTRRAAEKAKASGGKPDECAELISKDVDTEASLQCLNAEIAFNIAVTTTGEIEELKDQFATQSLVQKLSGGEAPAEVTEKIADLRTKAVAKLADATKAYEAAEKPISGSSAKSGTGSVSGTNYVWQVQVGEAAVQLLRASLAAIVDGTPDREAQDKAYELLTKVAQGREQSPLISTAIDTLQYLQQTAR